MPRTVYRTCALCEACCGLTFEVEGDRITNVANDPQDPFSRGFCCPKGLASGDLHHDPDRLERPLRKQPDGSFREVGWDEALAAASEGLGTVIRRRGIHALGVYVGNPTVHNVGAALAGELLREILPTHNRYSANSQDANPHLLANYLMFGMQLAHPVPDLDRTQHLVIVGGNPLVSNGSLMTAPRVGARLRAIRKRGGRVVVVDPRRTETARVASEHLFIPPGRDALLLLSMLREICKEDRWDQTFLNRWAVDWRRLPELLAPFDPERVSPLLGPDLSPDVIRRMARELSEAESAAVYARLGPCNTAYAGVAIWAVNLLNIVTGNLDRVGGVMFPHGPASGFFKLGPARGGYARWRSPQGAPEVSGEYPCHVLADQMERGQRDPSAPEAILGMLTIAGNPVLSAPNGPRIDRAFEKLEFMVSLDIYLSETARRADVILPPRSNLHEPHFDPIFSHLSVEDIARWSPAVLPPPPNHPSEFELITRLVAGIQRRARLRGVKRGLLSRLGPHLTPERFAGLFIRFGARGKGLNPFKKGLTLEQLESHPHGMPPRPLEPRLADRLVNREKRIVCAPEPYVRDLPRLVALLEQAPGSDDLLLIGRRHLKSNNSWFHNLPRLQGGTNRCSLRIHPDDAQARDLQDGGRAEVRSRVGRVEVDVEVTDEMIPGVVSLPHGWGHADHGGEVASATPGVSVNDLADDQAYDPVTGNSAINGFPVTVRALVPATQP